MTILYLYEYGTKVSFNDNRIVINSEDQELSLPCENVEGVILFGSIQLTGKVVSYLIETEIPVVSQ